MAKFAKIEDIMEELSSDLYQRGFSKVQNVDKEILRYEKTNSPVKFQVGIEQYKMTEKNLNLIIFILFYY